MRFVFTRTGKDCSEGGGDDEDDDEVDHSQNTHKIMKTKLDIVRSDD